MHHKTKRSTSFSRTGGVRSSRSRSRRPRRSHEQTSERWRSCAPRPGHASRPASSSAPALEPHPSSPAGTPNLHQLIKATRVAPHLDHNPRRAREEPVGCGARSMQRREAGTTTEHSIGAGNFFEKESKGPCFQGWAGHGGMGIWGGIYGRQQSEARTEVGVAGHRGGMVEPED